MKLTKLLTDIKQRADTSFDLYNLFIIKVNNKKLNSMFDVLIEFYKLNDFIKTIDSLNIIDKLKYKLKQMCKMKQVTAYNCPYYHQINFKGYYYRLMN